MRLFKRRKKLSFIEQEYAREGRKCPSEAPGGSVTTEPICGNDICKAFREAGVNADEASKHLNYNLGLLGTAILAGAKPAELQRLQDYEYEIERNRQIAKLMED